MNVSMVLDMVAENVPDRVAFGDRADGLGYGSLVQASRRVATHLAAHGVRHLGLVDVNSVAMPLGLFGAARAGIPFAPVNYRLPDDKLVGVLERLAPALVVLGEDVATRIGRIEGIETVTRDDFIALATSDVGEGDELPSVEPEAIAVLLFTSGTTGDPKAAVLRHHHLTSYVLGSVDFLGADEAEAQLVAVPAYHIAGISAVLSSTFAGRRVAYLSAFDAEGWVAEASAQEVTQAMVVPTMLGRILDVLDATGKRLEHLRHLSYGGGRMPLEVIKRAMAALPGVSLVNAYGLTETSSTISVLGPDDHVEAFQSDDATVQNRLCSVGRPLPSVEVEIRDPLGDPVPAGERGEIFVRGEQISGEYLGRSTLVEGGWFPTNDCGYLDAEGYLFLDGRLDDVIVRGAENLSPGEIEDVLMAHPAVSDAAVVGVPDSEWGEAVAAAVVLEPGATVSAADLKDHVRRQLRSTKTPQEIRFLHELPYNETGKLLRRVLKEDFAVSSIGPA